jgi:pentatricopeptide repeat domain (PPR motif)
LAFFEKNAAIWYSARFYQYSALISAFERDAKFEHALAISKEMQQYGIVPDFINKAP